MRLDAAEQLAAAKEVWGRGDGGEGKKQGSITGASLYELSYARHHNGLAGENDVFEPICLEGLAIASLANTMIGTFALLYWWRENLVGIAC